jgi:hypothetical protein|tara:strand:- start:2928 stop:3434 length:507 start_codon:yes stop_codon:yes gene_type:complete
MKKELKIEFVLDILATITGGIVLSFLFFIFSDFIHKTPNLSGRWYFVNETESTSYKKFKGLKVYYTVLLMQEGNNVYGTGEKIKDDLNGEISNYSGSKRVHIKIAGHLKNNFLTKDTLNIHYTEKGSLRPSSTLHNLIRFDDEYMSGKFYSTIADSEGKIKWTRKEPS